jgi:hypothetical protein
MESVTPMTPVTLVTETEPIKKKRGRKPKNPDDKKEPVIKEKKKRGRKPKIQKDPENEVPRVRKRGRKPKCPIKSISEIREKFEKNGDRVKFDKSSNVVGDSHTKSMVPFGNLNITVYDPPKIDTTELRKKFNINQESKIVQQPPTKVVESESESESESENENENEINTEQCKKCNCCVDRENNGELVKVEKKKVSKQLYKFSNNLDESGEWANKTDILCWWCCHTFDTIPIPSVTKYDERRKRYHLRGLFCSWECSASFTLEKSKNLNWLYRLFREWTGEKLNGGKLKTAPSRYVLKSFGGHMSIDDYRKSSYENRKIFLSETNQMSYINQDILEIYTELEKKKKKKLKLARKKKTTQLFIK